MITFNKNTTVEDIINDGEYDSAVKLYIKDTLRFDKNRQLALFMDWIEEVKALGDTETVEYFSPMTEEEVYAHMSIDEIVDFYAEGSLADFALGLDIDWTGLEEQFGVD